MYASNFVVILFIISSVKTEEFFGNFTSRLYLNAFEALGETAFGAEEKIGRNIDLHELSFYVYTSENRGQETKLDPLNPVELTRGKGKIFFFLHGWIDAKKLNPWYNELTNKLLGMHKDARIVQIDWEAGSFQDYGLAAYSTESIGRHLATLINILVIDNHVPIEKFVLIGHSLGAQICGWTGKYFTKYTNQRLSRIIAFDPAGILFSERSDSRRLNRNDAKVVHVIHSDGGNLGFPEQCGTIDFFPNGGSKQPGCQHIDLKNPLKLFIELVWCDHFRSFDYFLEAVNDRKLLVAKQCPNEEALESRSCYGTEVSLGDLETTREGIYFLETNSKPPFSKSSGRD
ncbi:hypothetical protein HHI36_002645 [Cryptolaemus montrouzieri]|uniref:Lipase domain-containing protein n=1 Tax=Cryptolaemus montrouzieri TaxID=559131 RepID=A0ABD2PBE3_9CUCU